MMKLIFLIGILCSSLFFQSKAQTVVVTIEGIRSAQGVISLGIFTSQEEFAKEKPAMKKICAKTALKSGVLKVELELEPGNYGFALLDDENKDRAMNYNWLGIPQEGFGFSNFSSSGINRPTYSDFDFVVKPGENKVHIKMRYM